MAISKEAEQKIYDGLVRVAELVKAGSSPNVAITKVAKEDRIPAGHVRLMVNAYNVGRTNKQRTSSDNLFDKLAEFELADPAVILGEIYPKQIKSAAAVIAQTAVSDAYNLPPSWLTAKVASDRRVDKLYDEPDYQPAPRDKSIFFKKADGQLQQLRNERERLRTEMNNSWEKLATAFDSLHNYFRQAVHLPVDDVRTNAEVMHGQPATVLFDKLAATESCCMASRPVPLKKKTKKKEETPAPPMVIKRSAANHLVDRSQAPYAHVETCIEAAKQHREWFNKAAMFEKEAVNLELKLGRALRDETPEPMPVDPELSLLRRLRGEKRAILGGIASTAVQGAGLGLGADTGRSIVDRLSLKPKGELKDEALEDLSDPSHEAQLRAIRSQSALHGILNGPYFEGEDPVKATELFNNLTRLSPRMADQPLLLEAAMRRLSAQGSADPHDLDQLLGIETKMKMRDRGPKDSDTSNA